MHPKLQRLWWFVHSLYWSWGWVARGPKFWSFGLGLWSIWGPCNYWEWHFKGERWINISWNRD